MGIRFDLTAFALIAALSPGTAAGLSNLLERLNAVGYHGFLSIDCVALGELAAVMHANADFPRMTCSTVKKEWRSPSPAEKPARYRALDK